MSRDVQSPGVLRRMPILLSILAILGATAAFAGTPCEQLASLALPNAKVDSA